MVESGKRVSRKELFKGKIFTVAEDTIEFSDGSQTKWDVLLHSGAAAIVPIDNDGKIILVEQYRCVADDMILEIPAGKIDEGENPKDCAVRELEEETGYKAKEVKSIGSIYSAVGFSDEEIQLFVANGLERGHRNLDDNEHINVKKFSLNEIIEMIFNGEIKDSKTIAAVLKTKEMVQNKVL